MRRADTIARAAIANTRRRQLARLCEALELMVNTPARNADEEAHKEAAIADLSNAPHGGASGSPGWRGAMPTNSPQPLSSLSTAGQAA